MRIYYAANVTGDSSRARRTHGGYCDAELGATADANADPDDVTCRACRSAMRDEGVLP